MANEQAKLREALRQARVMLLEMGSSSDAFAEMDRAMVTRILTLCHPDRHGNSSISNDVSRYLIELRTKLPSR